VLVDLWEKSRKVRAQAALTAAHERRISLAVDRLERAVDLLPAVERDPQHTVAELRGLLETALDDLR